MLKEKYREDIINYLVKKTLAKHLISNSVDYFIAHNYKSGQEKYNEAKCYVNFPYFIWTYLLLDYLIKLARYIKNKLLKFFLSLN